MIDNADISHRLKLQQILLLTEGIFINFKKKIQKVRFSPFFENDFFETNPTANPTGFMELSFSAKKLKNTGFLSKSGVFYVEPTISWYNFTV